MAFSYITLFYILLVIILYHFICILIVMYFLLCIFYYYVMCSSVIVSVIIDMGVTFSLRCSVNCLCVNVYWITATGISEHFLTTLTEVLP
jgi:hypothetical protein